MSDMINMRASVISHTPNPEKTVAAAARLCYSPLGADEIMRDLSDEQTALFIAKLVRLGHTSPFEHASFTFAIDGVSRALSHQLVRHRIGVSFSQKSQRYVKERDFEYIMPPSVAENPAAAHKFETYMRGLRERYAELIEMGIPAEDARYLLPNAVATNLAVTMNARSLLHFFSLRCCARAQWEIRALARLMLVEVRKIAPLLFQNAGPTCESMGICFEGEMSCGAASVIEVRKEPQI